MIRPPRYAFVFSRRVVIFAVIAVLLAMLPAIAWVSRLVRLAEIRLAQKRDEVLCDGHMTRIQGSLRWYQRTFGGLPPAHFLDDRGTPVHSWRVLISLTKPLPAGDFGNRYSLATPWNSPENLPLLYHEEGDRFACPADSEAVRSRYTSYVVVVGENTLWPGSEGRTEEELRGNDERILFIEIPRTDIPWMEPRDVTFEEALQMYTEWDGFRSARHPNGLHYVTLGGDLGCFSDIGDRDEFARLLQIRPVDDAQ